MISPLRQQLREQRKALSPALVQAASLQVANRCMAQSIFQAAEKIGYYSAHENEIDPTVIFKQANLLGKKAYFPVMQGNSLQFLAVTSSTCFAENAYGILEPSSGERIDADELDLIFVPVVAFNALCHRLGRGKGCYDRALQQACHPHLVGLAYAFQWVSDIKAASWDVALDVVITEERVYSITN